MRSSASQSIALYEPAEGELGRYAALSYVWGESSPYATTRANIEANKKGIVIEQLPKTFQDAILVAREMGIEYLWIDSLWCVNLPHPKLNNKQKTNIPQYLPRRLLRLVPRNLSHVLRLLKRLHNALSNGFPFLLIWSFHLLSQPSSTTLLTLPLHRHNKRYKRNSPRLLLLSRNHRITPLDRKQQIAEERATEPTRLGVTGTLARTTRAAFW